MSHVDIPLKKVAPKSFEDRVGLDSPRKKEFPKIRVSVKTLPAVGDWQNKKSYEVRMIVKQSASDEHGVELEIHKIGGVLVSTPKKVKPSAKRFSRL